MTESQYEISVVLKVEHRLMVEIEKIEISAECKDKLSDV